MYEFLEGFHRRMQLIGVVDALINRRNKKSELEAPIGDRQFENLIFSVLVFIMEKTLTEEEECTMKTIAAFVEQLMIEEYQYPSPTEMALPVSEYIVKTILQFDGKNTYYPVMNYEKKEWAELRIKLLDEKVEDRPGGYVSIYSLTDQGYDFLFRTKEVDNEISFSVEEFKLRELIKRKNYKKALQQSNNLVQMVRQKKRDLEQFIQTAKGNILELDLSKFDELINSTYKLLRDEYEMLGEILGMVRKSEERLKMEYSLRGELTEDLKKAQMELGKINQNLASARKEQMNLINEREGSYQILKSTLAESFQYTRQKRYDFEAEILRRMETAGEESVKNLWRLFNPLFHVEPVRHLPISLFYQRQGKLIDQDEVSEAGFLVDELQEDLEKTKNEKTNLSYLKIMKSIAEIAMEKGGETDFRTLCQELKKEEETWARLIEGNLLFITMLKLYELEKLDVEAWRRSKSTFLGNPTSEFNIDALLYQLNQGGFGYEQVNEIHFSKIEEESFEMILEEQRESMLIRNKIELDNIRIKVVKSLGEY